MSITSGTIDQVVYFIAASADDFTVRLSGLSAFVVVQARDGGPLISYPNPTVTELGAGAPGVYALVVSEDTIVSPTHNSEDLLIHIKHAGMQDVSIIKELEKLHIPPTVVQIDTQLSTTHGGAAWGGGSSGTATIEKQEEILATIGVPINDSVSEDIASTLDQTSDMDQRMRDAMVLSTNKIAEVGSIDQQLDRIDRSTVPR